MFSLILLILVGLGYGYFATQNTQLVTLTFANYTFPEISLYIVIGITLLVGFAICWIISLSDTLSSALKLRGKNSKIKDNKQTIQNLTKKVNQLEIENANLQGKLEKGARDESSL